MAIEQMKCYSELEHLLYRVYPALKNFPASELKANVKKRMNKRLKGFSSLYSSGTTVKQLEQKLNSWCAHAKVAKSQNYIDSLIHKFNWLTYTNNQFKINPDLLERLNKGTQ